MLPPTLKEKPLSLRSNATHVHPQRSLEPRRQQGPLSGELSLRLEAGAELQGQRRRRRKVFLRCHRRRRLCSCRCVFLRRLLLRFLLLLGRTSSGSLVPLCTGPLARGLPEAAAAAALGGTGQRSRGGRRRRRCQRRSSTNDSCTNFTFFTPRPTPRRSTLRRPGPRSPGPARSRAPRRRSRPPGPC